MSFIPSQIESRNTYLDRVKPFMGKNIIKVFTGQRRVGKSYLLFQIMDLVKNQYPTSAILYINKEDLQFSALKTAQELHDYVINNQANSGKTFVFIDEIQDIIDFQVALRSLVLHENLDVYCTLACRSIGRFDFFLQQVEDTFRLGRRYASAVPSSNGP